MGAKMKYYLKPPKKRIWTPVIIEYVVVVLVVVSAVIYMNMATNEQVVQFKIQGLTQERQEQL